MTLKQFNYKDTKPRKELRKVYKTAYEQGKFDMKMEVLILIDELNHEGVLSRKELLEKLEDKAK